MDRMVIDLTESDGERELIDLTGDYDDPQAPLDRNGDDREDSEEDDDPDDAAQATIAALSKRLAEMEDQVVAMGSARRPTQVRKVKESSKSIATKEAPVDNIEYAQKLENLSKQPPTPAQLRRLQLAASQGPNYIGRTASVTSGKNKRKYGLKSNGRTNHASVKPGAAVNPGQRCHSKLEDLTQGELAFMLGEHLAWRLLLGDEFSSFSQSALVLVLLALKRLHAGAKGTTVQFVDRRTTTASSDGSQVAFYPVQELYETLDIAKQHPHGDRHPLSCKEMFTHEYLAHGSLTLETTLLQPASIEDLISAGLLELLPALPRKKGERVPLTASQYRALAFPPLAGKSPAAMILYAGLKKAQYMTPAVLKYARSVALCFTCKSVGQAFAAREPPLAIFLHFLCFAKRKSRDETFVSWIKSRYQARDVLDIIDDGKGRSIKTFTRVVANLPECAQYIDLVRDCCYALSMPPLPPNELVGVIEKRIPRTAPQPAFPREVIVIDDDDDDPVEIDNRARRQEEELHMSDSEDEGVGMDIDDDFGSTEAEKLGHGKQRDLRDFWNRPYTPGAFWV